MQPGGGGNEDRVNFFFVAVLSRDSKPPDSVPPADRLRAVLPVGTNRAPIADNIPLPAAASLTAFAMLKSEAGASSEQGL